MHGRWRFDQRGAAIEPIELLTSSKERLQGLLFRKPDALTRLLLPCRDVHTFGMRYPIDIAFADERGRVLEVHRWVGARRRKRCRGAAMVAERFSSGKPWFEVGDLIGLGALEGCSTSERSVGLRRKGLRAKGRSWL